MKEILKRMYGLETVLMEHSAVGAGSDTYFVTCTDGKYVVKYPASSEINHPEQEPELCEYLNHHGIPCCRFLRNRTGEFLTSDTDGRLFHVQRFIEGKMYDWHEAPDWLLTQSAQMLGRIHTALKDYPCVPVGIGKDFFQYMTPERALRSYENSLAIAKSRGDTDNIHDLQYRIELMSRFPKQEFDLDQLTCCATHGDFFISQILCGDGKINAVIDWTTACVHPVVWEIVRSYVYAAPSCKNGEIDKDGFARYVSEYLKFAALNASDLRCMVSLFYYQIAVCDYYGQYYASTAGNRHIYLRQAVFSTKLLRWLEGISYRQAFGEYMIYYNGKVPAYLCDDRLLVKITPGAQALMPDAFHEPPYEGAKDMLLVEDVDNRAFLKELFEAMWPELPEPKKKKGKSLK